MYKIILSLFLSLFFVSCGFSENKIELNNSQSEKTINTGQVVKKEKIIEIKNWLKISINNLEEVKNMCNSYENEYSWKDLNFIKNNIYEKTISHIKEDLKWDNLESYIDLKNWEIKWVYSDFQDIASIKLVHKNNKYEKDKFYFYLANYMLFLKDKNLYENYKKVYLELVNSENENINENYIIPLFSTEIAFSWKCKKIINDNFVSY